MQIRKILATAFAVLSTVAASGQDTEKRLMEHVYYLASDEMNGRKAGSADALRAAEYIKGQYEAAGVQPFFETWEQTFERSSTEFVNIVGVIEGSDPALKDEFVLLGAHYDHLGIRDGKIYNGADDNASGSAALIEIARELCQHRDELRRSVIIAAFDAEELGLYGSERLAKRLSGTGIKIVAMMSIDMVGWYRQSGKLILEGAGTIDEGEAILKRIALEDNIKIKTKDFENSIFTATDTEGFARNGVPTLAVTTGTKSPYHKPEDDPDLIDYKGLALVVDYIGDVTKSLAGETGVKPSGKYAMKHKPDQKEDPFGLDISLLAGIGSATMQFKDAAFTGIPGDSYMGGISARAKLGFLKIRTAALVERSVAPFPSLDRPFSSKTSYRQTALTVPVTVDIIRIGDGPFEVFYGMGGYYSRALGHPGVEGYLIPVSKNQAGIAFNIMMAIGRFNFGAYGFSQAGRIFTGNTIPIIMDDSRTVYGGFIEDAHAALNSNLYRGYFTLGWRF